MLFRSILVGVEGEGPTATFTFKGEKVGELPDLPPFETAEIGAGDEPGPTDVPRSTGDDGEAGSAGAVAPPA